MITAGLWEDGEGKGHWEWLLGEPIVYAIGFWYLIEAGET